LRIEINNIYFFFLGGGDIHDSSQVPTRTVQTSMNPFLHFPKDVQWQIMNYLPFRYHFLLLHDFWTMYSFSLPSKANIQSTHVIPIQLLLDFFISNGTSYFTQKETELSLFSTLHSTKDDGNKKIRLEISTKWKTHTEKYHHEYWEQFVGKIFIDFLQNEYPKTTTFEFIDNDFIHWYSKQYVDYTLGWESCDGGYKDYF